MGAQRGGVKCLSLKIICARTPPGASLIPVKPLSLPQLVIAVVALGSTVSTMSAQTVLGSYQFNSVAAPVVLSSSDLDVNSTASDVFAGAGADLGWSNTDVKAENGASFLTINAATATVNTLAVAISNDVSFKFTITPVGGAILNFTSISGLVRRSATSSTRGWALRSSLTGTTDLALDSAISAFRNNAMESLSPDFGTLNLSGVTALQGVTGAVTFVIYANTGTGPTPSTGRVLDFDNIQVLGNVTAVPEPSAFALLGVGMLAMLIVNRRRRTLA